MRLIQRQKYTCRACANAQIITHHEYMHINTDTYRHSHIESVHIISRTRCWYIHLYIHTYIHTYSVQVISRTRCWYIHVYIHTYIYKYIHTYIQALSNQRHVRCSVNQMRVSVWSRLPLSLPAVPAFFQRLLVTF